MSCRNREVTTLPSSGADYEPEDYFAVPITDECGTLLRVPSCAIHPCALTGVKKPPVIMSLGSSQVPHSVPQSTIEEASETSTATLLLPNDHKESGLRVANAISVMGISDSELHGMLHHAEVNAETTMRAPPGCAPCCSKQVKEERGEVPQIMPRKKYQKGKETDVGPNMMAKTSTEKDTVVEPTKQHQKWLLSFQEESKKSVRQLYGSLRSTDEEVGKTIKQLQSPINPADLYSDLISLRSKLASLTSSLEKEFAVSSTSTPEESDCSTREHKHLIALSDTKASVCPVPVKTHTEVEAREALYSFHCEMRREMIALIVETLQQILNYIEEATAEKSNKAFDLAYASVEANIHLLSAFMKKGTGGAINRDMKCTGGQSSTPQSQDESTSFHEDPMLPLGSSYFHAGMLPVKGCHNIKPLHGIKISAHNLHSFDFCFVDEDIESFLKRRDFSGHLDKGEVLHLRWDGSNADTLHISDQLGSSSAIPTTKKEVGLDSSHYKQTVIKITRDGCATEVSLDEPVEQLTRPVGDTLCITEATLQQTCSQADQGWTLKDELAKLPMHSDPGTTWNNFNKSHRGLEKEVCHVEGTNVLKQSDYLRTAPRRILRKQGMGTAKAGLEECQKVVASHSFYSSLAKRTRHSCLLMAPADGTCDVIIGHKSSLNEAHNDSAIGNVVQADFSHKDTVDVLQYAVGCKDFAVVVNPIDPDKVKNGRVNLARVKEEDLFSRSNAFYEEQEYSSLNAGTELRKLLNHQQELEKAVNEFSRIVT